METPLPADFKEFLRLLNSKGVRYLLVGGYAVAVHGYLRSTGDMDIWVDTAPQNAAKVAAAVKEFGFAAPELTAGLFEEQNQVIRMGVPPLRLEILTTLSGVDFEDCYQARMTIDVEGIPLPLLSLEHLKRNKRAAGRLKDLADLEQLP